MQACQCEPNMSSTQSTENEIEVSFFRVTHGCQKQNFFLIYFLDKQKTNDSPLHNRLTQPHTIDTKLFSANTIIFNFMLRIFAVCCTNINVYMYEFSFNQWDVVLFTIHTLQFTTHLRNMNIQIASQCTYYCVSRYIKYAHGIATTLYCEVWACANLLLRIIYEYRAFWRTQRWWLN